MAAAAANRCQNVRKPLQVAKPRTACAVSAAAVSHCQNVHEPLQVVKDCEIACAISAAVANHCQNVRKPLWVAKDCETERATSAVAANHCWNAHKPPSPNCTNWTPPILSFSLNDWLAFAEFGGSPRFGRPSLGKPLGFWVSANLESPTFWNYNFFDNFIFLHVFIACS